MSFSQFLTILRARSALILGVVLLAGAIGVAVTLAMPQRYFATVTVVVDPNAAQAASASAMGAGRPDEFMSTHLDIVTSPAAAGRVIDGLGLDRRPDIGTLLSGSRLLHNASQMIALMMAGDGEEDGAKDPRDWIAGRLLRNLSVKANRDSRMLRMTYTASDPEFAAAVANSFARAYLDILHQLQVAPAREYSDSFDEPIRAMKRDLEAAETKLARFQQQKGIVASDERFDLETARLNDLSAQIASAQALSYESQARQRQMRDFLARGSGDAPAEVLASPAVQQLKQTVSDREAKLAELSRRVGPNHPQYRAAVTELEGQKAQLNEQLRSAAQGLLTSGDVAGQREGALRAALSQQRGKVLAMKNDRNTLAVLTRDVDSARQAYESAQQRATQARTASQAGQTSGTVVDSATPPLRPASPRPTLNVAIALAVGMVLGIGLALYRESVDGFVRSERDVVEVLGTPVLAVLLPRGGRRNVHRLPANIHMLPGRTG